MTKVTLCALVFLSLCSPVIWWFDKVGNDKYDSSAYLECSGVMDAVAKGKTNIVPRCFIDETEGIDEDWEICLLGRFWPIYVIAAFWLSLFVWCMRQKKVDETRMENENADKMLLSEDSDSRL